MAELITDALPLPLGRGFREDLVSNFKIIKQNLDSLNSDSDNGAYEKIVVRQINKLLEDPNSDLRKALLGNVQQLTDRINRIILGTDHDSIELVLKDILGDSIVKGDIGETGANGQSAYQIWLAAGNTGSEQDFLASLRGKDGISADGVKSIVAGMGLVKDNGNGSITLSGKTYVPANADDLQYQTVPAGTDLLTLTNNTGKTQYYACHKMADAKAMTNVPVVTAFNLIARPVNPADQAIANNGNPIWTYTTLEFRPYNSGLVYVASTTTDGDGELSSTPWVLLADDSKVQHVS
ncbi:collagen-like protein [Lactiplantibacillus plantarum]|uniref:collagen-like protein n=1 Tax=Lactiplantibacillus plantarum TaxID=1590 RepID=UPI00143D2C9B|nr:collagen-like protein [Lactiplantibacillus plantarum]MBE1727393.1 collagen-like protein [Lactiplantibacillus plantarum]NKI39458.1 collagen-like protein [Lactiplantibacillus plantarum]